MAHEALFQATGGFPRKLNLLAHHALLAAAFGGRRMVIFSGGKGLLGPQGSGLLLGRSGRQHP